MLLELTNQFIIVTTSSVLAEDAVTTSIAVNTTVDDINPALPMIRNIP